MPSIWLEGGGAPTALLTANAIDIPHDPATIFIYLLVAAAVAVTWYANRKTKQDSGAVDPLAGPDRDGPASPGATKDETPEAETDRPSPSP